LPVAFKQCAAERLEDDKGANVEIAIGQIFNHQPRRDGTAPHPAKFRRNIHADEAKLPQIAD
jgi:hypothetical protein